MNTHSWLIGLGLFSAACTNDHAVGLDGGLDCTPIKTPQGTVPRGCTFEIPTGTTLAWGATYREVLAVGIDGGVVASWNDQSCTCEYGSSGFNLIPKGADPTLWGPGGSISTAGYDQSCQTASDCVAVGSGDFSFACLVDCPFDVIAKSAQPAYEAALLAKRQGGVFDSLCVCPPTAIPVCLDGQCRAARGILVNADSSDAGIELLR